MRALVLLAALLAVPIVLAAAPHEIEIVGGGNLATFLPFVFVMQAGESVVWTNSDFQGAAHIVTGTGGFDTGRIAAGETSAPVTFDAPGAYYYRCPLHSTMRFGEIHVV